MNKTQSQEYARHKSNKKAKSIKRKNDCIPTSDKILDGFVDNQKKIFKTVSSQLQNASEEKGSKEGLRDNSIINVEPETAKTPHSECFIAQHLEQEKLIKNLNERLQSKETAIKNLENELQTATENYRTTLADFSVVKENFFQYEKNNDQLLKIHKQENEELGSKLLAQQTEKTDLIKNLADLQMQLQKKWAENNDIVDLLKKSQEEITKIHTENILYKEQQELEIQNLKQKYEQEINNLKLENFHKDETLMQYKNHTEAEHNEKNRLIQELKYKISNIERLLDQPGRSVRSRVENQASSTSNFVQSNYNNVAVTKPQKHDSASVESQQQHRDNKTTLRSFRNPSPPIFSSQSNNKEAKNAKTNRTVNEPVHTSPLSDGNENNSDASIGFWRPSMMENSSDDSCIIQETSDASDSFSKPKRFKK